MSDESSVEELKQRAEELGRKAEENPDGMSDSEWDELTALSQNDDVSEVEAVGDD